MRLVDIAQQFVTEAFTAIKRDVCHFFFQVELSRLL